ncbi:MAG: tRNA (adenosine(37)-N6)-dimethylallyltransferase MiaA [Anaerolineales bacterium]|nr:tRNA (adenosine(37)-N6)-dimethylallyltransferase MiaA [Anaerolineales bacterium]
MFRLEKPERVTGRLLVILGPTAVGKTALSLQIAGRFSGQIISADSRLFYKGMDIGTAKPDAREQALVPHHLINIAAPDENLSLGTFQDMAYAAINAVLAAGDLPIVVGGTGQYVSAIVEGWGIPRVPPQVELRAELDKLATEELGRWLLLLDPVAATRLDFRNRRRVIRALEVTLVAGQPISQLQAKLAPPYDIRLIGLTTDREQLYERIDRRVDQMVAAGFAREVGELLAAGYRPEQPVMSALGYREMFAYLAGETTLAEATERIKFATHAFVRRQYNWFRRDDPAIHWYETDAPDFPAVVMADLAAWLQAEGLTNPTG